MQKIWNYVSGLGLARDGRQLNPRTIVLTNQLNFIMFITMFFLLIYTLIALKVEDDITEYGTLRVVILMIVTILNIVLARYGFTQIAKFSLIYLPPIVFLLGPIFIGYVEEEGYIYNPYVMICVSVIPQLLLDPKKEKIQYWFSLSYYFILAIFIDKIMVLFQSENFAIVDRINSFYLFYKIAHIGLFLFINACIYYLRMLNFRFEEELNRKNRELDLQNIELKSNNVEIERQKDELVNKEIDTWQKLVSIISHEIVNSAIPITNLAGMSAQMLEDDSGVVLNPAKIEKETAEEIHNSLKIIESRTKGLISFVKATKDLTHIPKPNIRNISVQELLERVTILYKGRFSEAGVQFYTEVSPGDLNINADLELIEQVIINLIQNALEALHDTSHPKLEINATVNKSGQVQISVSDNGPGISDEVQERIFLPFFSTKTNNAGIGLSLSQQIMLLHNARIAIVSDQKPGATFLMLF
jgi:signal transduction histidine kinase